MKTSKTSHTNKLTSQYTPTTTTPSTTASSTPCRSPTSTNSSVRNDTGNWEKKIYIEEEHEPLLVLAPLQ